MQSIIKLENVTKRYKDFMLDHVSFEVPKGCIMGFVGENGAGKSTTIKAILNLVHLDEGEITLFDSVHTQNELEKKQHIGVVFDETHFAEMLTLKHIGKMMQSVYKNWDQQIFGEYAKRFGLPEKKTIKEYSRGMKMKLSIAIALSHHAKLLILDEATSGLDPIVRDEILDVFLEFIQDEQNSIFFSSHITSDLEKIADYITFIHKGKIYFSEQKDKLLESYGVLKCSKEEFEKVARSAVRGVRTHQFGIEALVEKEKIDPALTVDPATIEDIMLFMVKGEEQ